MQNSGNSSCPDQSNQKPSKEQNTALVHRKQYFYGGQNHQKSGKEQLSCKNDERKERKAISIENNDIRNHIKGKKQLLCIEKAVYIKKKAIKNRVYSSKQFCCVEKAISEENKVVKSHATSRK